MFETVATLAPAPDSAPDWPATWAEVPGERFAHDDTEYAVVSVPAGTDDPRIRRDLAPMRCDGGYVYRVGPCEHPERDPGHVCDHSNDFICSDCPDRDRDLVPLATCPHACPGSRGLYPVELAGRESCARCLAPVESP
jgi:hypothetical protein